MRSSSNVLSTKQPCGWSKLIALLSDAYGTGHRKAPNVILLE